MTLEEEVANLIMQKFGYLVVGATGIHPIGFRFSSLENAIDDEAPSILEGDMIIVARSTDQEYRNQIDYGRSLGYAIAEIFNFEYFYRIKAE